MVEGVVFVGASPMIDEKADSRYRWCTRYRENSNSPRSSERIKTKSRRWSKSTRVFLLSYSFFDMQEREVTDNKELPPFSYVEINGLKIPSPQHAYTVLWEAVSGVKGCSSKTALRGLEGHFGRKTAGVRGPRGHTLYVLLSFCCFLARS